MPAVSEAIVREYFEAHGFLIRQHRKYVAPARREEDDIDFFVLNSHPQKGETEVPFILTSNDLQLVQRAIVAVKGWHTETFSSALLTHEPQIFRFVEPRVLQQAAQVFGKDGPLLKILVLPTLPQTASTREQSITMLRAKGIDAVILFDTILADLIARTEANRNYQKSDLLQIIRILKNYGFLKEPQLELFKNRRKRG